MDETINGQAPDKSKAYTFEDVWAALMESRVRNEELRVRMDESYVRMVESHKRTDAEIDKLSKNIGGLGNTLGALIEEMFTPDLWMKFEKIGLPIHSQSRYKNFNDGKRVIAEVDVYLENGEYVIPVEIKTDLSENNVNEHIERIAIIRDYMDARNDGRKLIGAVAGGIVRENVRNYAHKKGMYVIEQNGGSASIAPAPMNFVAREW